MERLLILCCSLLTLASVGSCALCLSNMGCPNNATDCVRNCSAVAIELGHSASQGNCEISLHFDTGVFHGCLIDDCISPYPTLCVAVTVESTGVIECCCTEDNCNQDLASPPDEPTENPDLPDVIRNATHIYSSFPNHTTSDQQVCSYLNCTNSECITGYEVCEEGPTYDATEFRYICFAIFLMENGTLVPNSKRCFNDPHSDCPEEECVLSPHSSFSELYDCCCLDNLCNLNTSVELSTTVSTTSSAIATSSSVPEPTMDKSDDDDNKERVHIIYGVVGSISFLIIVVLVVIVIVFYCYYRLKIKRGYGLHGQPLDALINSPVSLVSMQSIDNVELVKQVGRGRFATVWKANLSGRAVAIKVFSMFSMDSWNHERDIYSTPFFEHDSLLHFIAADQKTVGYETEYWLVTTYHEYGSLLDFLRARTVNLEDFCLMAESVAAGLAHLHCIFTRNGIYKPAIVHRDFKSKNVLVKNDLSCVISDFGLAFRFVSGESPVEAQGQVGTTRYMSPEVLEGAVNFQREAFMRIDMYACGLVLWEIASRCVIDGVTPGEYMQPFEDVLKGNPSIEMMKQVVITTKKRPEFPLAFNVNPQLESLMTTITECWDHDAEARLSAKTVEERIRGLYRDICKPPIIDNEKDLGLMVSLTPSQSMPVFAGKESSSSGVSCSMPNSPHSNASLSLSPKLIDNMHNPFTETPSPTPITNGHVHLTDYIPMENGHRPHHSQVVNSNGSSNKNHKAIAVHKPPSNRFNGRIHSFSETTL